MSKFSTSAALLARAGRKRRLRAADLRQLLPGERPSSQPLRVRLAGSPTALVAPGGGEIQMAAHCAALRELGIDAQMWRPWEESLADIECLHLFGSSPAHLPLVSAAHKLGKRVVLSPIAWFDIASRWGEPGALGRRVVGTLGQFARTMIPSLPSWRRLLYQSVDHLLPNSQLEADQLARYFGVDRERMTVVPNAAEWRFALARPEPFVERFGLQGFALCAGRVEPRKNQLALINALAGIDAKVVVLGDPAPGYERYYRQCRRAAEDNVRFIPRVPHDDPLLASCYAAAGCLALPSWFETPGLVALEAGMSGVPLVVTTRGSAREYFAEHARYVSPSDAEGIRKAVEAALKSPRSEPLARHVQGRYQWRKAAQLSVETYRNAA